MRLLLVFLLMAIAMADIRANLAGFNDNSTYIIDSGARAGLLVNGVESLTLITTSESCRIAKQTN